MTSPENALPTGGAWAAILAAAIGCACFGILADLAEISKPISKALNFYNPTGDLSGKSTLGVVAWLVAWGILHMRWKDRDIHCPGRITLVSLILILLALVMVFPPFVEMIAG